MWAEKGEDGTVEIHDTDVSWTTIDKNEAIELALDILKVVLTTKSP